jgi:16S rRNA (guanine(966)-N(2))-methyltransferase RsmD
MSTLRVISGSARGQRLKPVPGETTRPITDRVKESLFNILGPDVQGAVFLDLFAGTGSVGIEALSRGADYVLFLDLNRLPIKTVRENLARTNFGNKALVRQADAFSFLKGASIRKFDYVYIAPPQYKGLWEKTLILLDDHVDWLFEDSWVIVQIHPKEYKKIPLKRLIEFDQRKYGNTLLVFYQLIAEK